MASLCVCSKRRLLIGSIYILITLAGCRVFQTCNSQDEPNSRVEVDFNELPDLFFNDKLPSNSNNDKNVVCYNLLGCYERLPIASYEPHDPTKFKTEFHIYSKNRTDGTTITYQPTENCLRHQTDTCALYPFDLGSIRDSPFKIAKRTIILIGGYMSKAPNRWETNLKDIWLQLDDVNVIIIGWARANFGLYRTAALNTRPVARQLVVLLYYLAKLNGFDLKDDSFNAKIYLIGHSLGAHIAGFVGHDLAGKVGRITGLEAAGPNFDDLDARFRLDRTDAQLVDAMHTNEGAKILFDSQYGTALTIGHIDLYANDGCHQPGCGSDMFGCSHKRATTFYDKFLLHHLTIKKQFKAAKNIDLYRLNAYSSPDYIQFHNGSALARNCPITILNNDDLNSVDLNQCSIPIDYASWFDVVKDELQRKHWVNFDPDVTSNRKYYFYTTDETNDVHRDHYLLKIQANNGLETNYPDGCDITFDINMTNGFNAKHTIEKYRLMSMKDAYEIVVPFLSASSLTKNELALLDSKDYYSQDKSVNNQDRLLESLLKIFPSSISIDGATFEETKTSENDDTTNKKGFIGFFKDLYNMAAGDEKTLRSCELSLKSITIQPLRRMHRHLLATYSDKVKPIPEIIALKEGEESSRANIVYSITRSFDDAKPGFFVNQFIIGPYDSNLDLTHNKKL